MHSQEATLFHRYIDSPIGKIKISCSTDAITAVEFAPQIAAEDSGLTQTIQPEVMTLAVAQIGQYFAGERQYFTLPIAETGSAFRRRVWQAMTAIPYGQVRAYGDIADELQSAARAVGGACRHNPLPIIQPCHRVVAKSGIGGFSGQWREGQLIDIKRWLLEHERRIAEKVAGGE